MVWFASTVELTAASTRAQTRFRMAASKTNHLRCRHGTDN
jgi:hypothetical protein